MIQHATVGSQERRDREALDEASQMPCQENRLRNTRTPGDEGQRDYVKEKCIPSFQLDRVLRYQ